MPTSSADDDLLLNAGPFFELRSSSHVNACACGVRVLRLVRCVSASRGAHHALVRRFFGFFLCSVPVEVAALEAERFWRTTACVSAAALVPPLVAATTLVLKVAAAAAAAVWVAAAPPSAAHVFGSLLLAVLCFSSSRPLAHCVLDPRSLSPPPLLQTAGACTAPRLSSAATEQLVTTNLLLGSKSPTARSCGGHGMESGRGWRTISACVSSVESGRARARAGAGRSAPAWSDHC